METFQNIVTAVLFFSFICGALSFKWKILTPALLIASGASLALGVSIIVPAIGFPLFFGAMCIIFAYQTLEMWVIQSRK